MLWPSHACPARPAGEIAQRHRLLMLLACICSRPVHGSALPVSCGFATQAVRYVAGLRWVASERVAAWLNNSLGWVGFVTKFVQQCLVCQQAKSDRSKLPGLLQPLQVPSANCCLASNFNGFY